MRVKLFRAHPFFHSTLIDPKINLCFIVDNVRVSSKGNRFENQTMKRVKSGDSLRVLVPEQGHFGLKTG